MPTRSDTVLSARRTTFRRNKSIRCTVKQNDRRLLVRQGDSHLVAPRKPAASALPRIGMSSIGRKPLRALTIGMLLICCLPLVATAEDNRDPTVGAAGWIDGIVLPGSELVGKPLDPVAPIIVRVVKATADGDSFRYDLQFHGMEPGKYNLAEWLLRKDGTATDDLPEISVEVVSLLPPGQIEPNALDQGILPWLGGYRKVATALVVLWLAGLVAMILWGSWKRNEEVVEEEPKVTLADMLQARLESASSKQMDPKSYAELERMLFAFWRKRLNLEELSVEAALADIHADQDAGPLMKQLELWMHSPNPDKDVDLAQLLLPYRSMPADAMDLG